LSASDGPVNEIVAEAPAAIFLRLNVIIVVWPAVEAVSAEQVVELITTPPADRLEVPVSVQDKIVVPVTVTWYPPSSSPPVSVDVITIDGLTVDK
jgi:hypothetical protein